jgi:hypothetical protein
MLQAAKVIACAAHNASRIRAWMVVLVLALTVSAFIAVARVTHSRTAVDNDTPPRVEGVYPSAERLPANLLRLYVVFSTPMTVGESRTRLRLEDDRGRTVERAFLALDEELWDPSGRRLTVLFDPGRIKRGLRANIEMGPPLVEGCRYRLIVDAGWRDASGRAISAPFVRTFEADAPRRDRPDPGTWSIRPPRAGTRTPLVVRFAEPLDRALLFTSMAVDDPLGNQVHGSIDVSDEETEWWFTPDNPWAAGSHRLRVSPDLEDPAGNSVARVFDAQLSMTKRDPPTVFTRGFLISPSGRPTS